LLPLLFLGKPLVAAQVYGSLMTAAAVSLMLYSPEENKTMQPSLKVWFWLAVLLVSPFFLVHLQNLWPKFVAGGCVLLAVREAMVLSKSPSHNSLLTGLFWLFAGVAFHESTILYLPMFMLLCGWRTLVKLAVSWKIWLEVFLIAMILVGSFQIWTLAKFGLNSRIKQNPALTYDQGLTLPKKMTLNAVGTLFGFLPADLEKRWSATTGAPPSKRAETAVYTVIAVVSCLASTLLGIHLACVWLFWRRFKNLLFCSGSSGFHTAFWWGSAIAFIGYCFLLGMSPRYGAAQGGLTQWSLIFMYFYFVHIPGVLEVSAARRLFVISGLFGLLPFVVINCAMTMALYTPSIGTPAFMEKLAKLDGDFYCFYYNKLQNLASVTYPFGILAGVAMVGGFLYYSSRFGVLFQNKLSEAPTPNQPSA
jgi:hypothetical protein